MCVCECQADSILYKQNIVQKWILLPIASVCVLKASIYIRNLFSIQKLIYWKHTRLTVEVGSDKKRVKIISTQNTYTLKLWSIANTTITMHKIKSKGLTHCSDLYGVIINVF